MPVTLHEAAEYMSVLTWRNGWEAPQSFFTVHDRKTDPSLTTTLHGTLSEHADRLIDFNRRGAGVFVTVNMTDGRGRKAENIQALRAVFIDMDEPLTQAFALPPTMTVQSKHGIHAYWCLWPEEPLDGFTPTQRRLSRYYGSDPSVCDLPRVMRLPGFMHMKGDPFLVRLLTARSHMAYRLGEVNAAHPVEEHPVVVPVVTGGTHRAYRNWAFCKPIVTGTRNRTAFSIACEGFRRGFTDEEVWLVVSEWTEKADILAECDDLLRSAQRFVARRTA